MDGSRAKRSAELFGQRLGELHNYAGRPPLNELVRLTEEVGHKMTRSTIQDKLSGASRPTHEQMMALVRACLAHAKRNGIPLSAGFSDEAKWRDFWVQTNRVPAPPQADQSVAAASGALNGRGEDEKTGPPLENAGKEANLDEPYMSSPLVMTGSDGKGLSDAYREKIARLREGDLELFRRVGSDPTASSIGQAISRAVKLNLIPQSGCRVRLANTYAYLSFHPVEYDNAGAETEEPTIRIQEMDGETKYWIELPEDASALDLLILVTEAVQALGYHPGDSLFDPARAFSDLQQLLEVAYERSTASEETHRRVMKIIELVPPQWVITPEGIARIDGRRGFIRNENLGDEEHVGRVVRVGDVYAESFDGAIRTAQLLYDRFRASVAYDPWSSTATDDPPF